MQVTKSLFLFLGVLMNWARVHLKGKVKKDGLPLTRTQRSRPLVPVLEGKTSMKPCLLQESLDWVLPAPVCWRIVTWLILPVVICLYQRLSHACLSRSTSTVKLRMAHQISYRLFDCTITTWITIEILELIQTKSPDFWKGCIY